MINEKDFEVLNKRGRKPKLFLVLDCETATLPFIKNWELTSQQKQKLAIAKPLIYDLAWKVVDRKGYVYSQHSFLIQETFFVPQIFDTAYYSWKRPLYMDRLAKGEIIIKNWESAIEILKNDLSKSDIALAYNAMFDYKKAIPFTESYIKNLYSTNYNLWEQEQQERCKDILYDSAESNSKDFDSMNFRLRGVDYPMADLWGLSCSMLINKDKYKMACLENGSISASGLYFKTSAETTFQFLIQDFGFEEEHTALSDVLIETEILLKCLKKGSIELGIQYFPFQELGRVPDFIRRSGKIFSQDSIENVLNIMDSRLEEIGSASSFSTQLETAIIQIENYCFETFKGYSDLERYKKCQKSQLQKKKNSMHKRLKKLKVGKDAYNRLWYEMQEIESELETYK